MRARGRRGKEASKSEVGFLKIALWLQLEGARLTGGCFAGRAVVAQGGKPGSCAGIFLPWSQHTDPSWMLRSGGLGWRLGGPGKIFIN